MCGRYTQDTTWADVVAFSRLLPLLHPDTDPEPAYNIAPTQSAWVILPDEGQGGRAQQLRWGLIPFWSKDLKIGYSTINARVESASSKPAFREPWKKRRCLVIASGYYEWRDEAAGKQPYWIHPAEGRLMLFAGLWDQNTQVAPEPVRSFSILTTDAQGTVTAVHDRMPLSLGPELLADWLHGGPETAANIALAAASIPIAYHRVGRAVGNVRNQGPGLVEPQDGP